MPYFTEPEEVLDYLHELLDSHKETLGLGYVGYADERLLPVYPAVVVTYNIPVDRTVYTTGTFDLEWNIQLLVYHARLSATRKTRVREDMQLAAAVRNKLHEDYSAGGGVIFGFVIAERPGIAADEKGNANFVTTLVWNAHSRAPINA